MSTALLALVLAATTPTAPVAATAPIADTGSAAAAIVVPATAAQFSGGAALRSVAVLVHAPGPAPLPAGWSGTHETRLRPHGTMAARRGSLGAALELRTAFTGAAAGVGAGGTQLLGAAAPLRIAPLKLKAVDDPNVAVVGWVDRLDAAAALGRVDVSVGRQPVFLGTGHLLSALDVVAPFAPGDLDATFRPGVDAVRVRVAASASAEIEAIAVGADPMRGGAVIGRARMALRSFDVEAVGGRSRRRNFAGVGWEGEAGPLNLWGEAAWFARGAEPWRHGWRRAAFAGVAGVEGRVASDLWMGGGASWQDFGVRRAGDLMLAAGDAPFVEGWRHLVGAAHAFATAGYEFHPLWRGDAVVIVNLDDRSVLAQPVVTLSVADEADVAAFAWVNGGAAPARGPFGVPRLRSEFGTLPRGGGLYARWFF